MNHTSESRASRLLLAALLVGLAASPALGQNSSAQPRPASPAPTRPAAPVQAQTQAAPFASLGQVCQMRERELVALNNQLVLRNQAAGREPDQQKRAQLLAPVEQLRANLTATETSWQRMDCVRVLYGR
jgi:hypothetical protein